MGSDYSQPISVQVPTLDGSDGGTINVGIYLGPNPDDPSTGIVEQVTENGIEVTIPFVVAWSDRYSLIKSLKGDVDTPDDGKTVQRATPTLAPYGGVGSPPNWNRTIFAGSGPFQRIGTMTSDGNSGPPSAGWLLSDLVIVPAYFETTTYQLADGLADGDLSGRWYTTTVFKPAGEIICPPTGAYYYNGNPNSPVQDQRVGIYRSRGELTITRHFMPYSGSEQMQRIVNCVNSDEITLTDGTKFAPGTMLLKNIECRPYVNPSTGLMVWDIMYYINVNTIGPIPNADIPTWNQIMDSTGAFTDIADKNNNPPFPSVAFIKEIWPDS